MTILHLDSKTAKNKNLRVYSKSMLKKVPSSHFADITLKLKIRL